MARYLSLIHQNLETIKVTNNFALILNQFHLAFLKSISL